MLIFQLRSQRPEEKQKPVAAWTVKRIKDEIPDCPDAVAQAILRTQDAKNMGRKVAEIKAALKSLDKNMDRSDLVFQILKKEVVELFVKHPDRFVEITKAAQTNDYSIIKVLENSDIANAFDKEPNRITKAFIDIAKVSGLNIEGVFAALENEQIAKLFIRHMDKLVEITKVAGKHTESAFRLFESEIIRDAFSKDPEKITRAIIDIIKATIITEFAHVKNIEDFSGDSIDDVCRVLRKLSKLFVKNLDKFVEIAKAAGKDTYFALKLLFESDIIRDAFSKDPEKITRAIIDIINATYNKEARYQIFFAEIDYSLTGPVLEVINGSFAEMFVKYAEGQITRAQFMINIYSSNEVGIELGRPLDDLDHEPEERKAYLAKLSTVQVLGLLLSDPEYFYTSSNHMLFDRLKKDIGNKSLSEVFEEYKVSDDLIRNFLFRTINYGRFCGKPDCLFSESDISKMIGVMLEPINAKKFDEKYYFLLANALDDIKTMPNVFDPIRRMIETRLRELHSIAALGRAPRLPFEEVLEPTVRSVTGRTKMKLQDVDRTISALQYILWKIDPDTSLVSKQKKERMAKLDENAYYDPQLHIKDGKLIIVQIFDKDDTANNHWELSQKWFKKKYDSEPETGLNGEIIYETGNARIILFMGETPEENQKFFLKQLEKTPNMIDSFRGHSYSLEESFPPKIFRNKKAHIVFIPGSCGSAGSIAEFIANNPDTEIRFFGNTSTGRGQVTNAIIDALIETPTRTKFSDILERAKARIEKHGGDISTIKVWSVGEALLRHVIEETATKTP